MEEAGQMNRQTRFCIEPEMPYPSEYVEGYKVCSPNSFPREYLNELLSCGAVLSVEGEPIHQEEDLNFLYWHCRFEFFRQLNLDDRHKPYIPIYKDWLTSIAWSQCLTSEDIRFALQHFKLVSCVHCQYRIDIQKAHELGLLILTYNRTALQLSREIEQEVIKQRKRKLDVELANKSSKPKRQKI
ncbi:hypothetical protein BCEN4_740064 [Burkholderia cenocepacia]|nr:hypothetical protein BCEN4_740064 [Burkholderia cenocepacia]